METTVKVINKLINEKSPYLLQHAHNPVNWYPWSDEAFEKAKKEDKPIFLSIGYSTCHWCHVMAHESFEDEEVAELMNDTFICIKVDREERPDIDNVYMTVCQMLTGHGGWPLSIIMTPDKKPFFAGTYIPKTSRYERLGMIELTEKTEEIWKAERDKIVDSAEGIAERIREASKSVPGDILGKETVDLCFKQLRNSFDKMNGGFGTSPKFPTPHNLIFLMNHYRWSKEIDELNMVTKTLDSISMGGIHDHLGYGFHRYSTDEKWLLPHFEKMLYDQAMLTLAYTDCYNITKNDYYKKVGVNILDYCERVLYYPEGAFYSAEDADSEGEEGKFYIWSMQEFKDILDDQELELLSKIYNVKAEGNFRDEATRRLTGLNILYQKEKLDEFIKNKYSSEVLSSLENISETLFKKREQRIHPHMDDKILTDWNGLIIAALSRASAIFEEEHFSDLAKGAADFFIKSIEENGKLYHRYCKGQWNVSANIDDYSFMIFGLIELYQTTFEVRYLKTAIKFMEEQIKYFWDEEGGFYFTSSLEEEVITRVKEIYDGAIPSGNSISLMNLIKLSRITGNTDYEEYAEKLIKAFSNEVKEAPRAYTQMLSGIQLFNAPSEEVVIVGEKNSKEVNEYGSKLRKVFSPSAVYVFKDISEENPEIHKLAEYTRQQEQVNNLTTIYICKNFTCNEPITSIDEALRVLK